MSRLTKSDLLIIVLAAAYVLMPVDFIPEIIAGPLGLTDDMAALAVIGAIIMRARNRTPEPAPATADPYADVVPGQVITPPAH